MPIRPLSHAICHCKNCQKGIGSAFATVVALPQPALSVQGDLKTYNDSGDSGKSLYRRFWPECGSSIMDKAEVMPGLVFILSGTLDDASWVKPQMEIFCDSAQPWVKLEGEQQRFPKMPARG